MDVTHVVVVTYINDVSLETSACFYTTDADRAQALARTLSSEPRQIVMPSVRGAPYDGTFAVCPVVGDVQWARL